MKFPALLRFTKSNKTGFKIWYHLYRKNRGVKIRWFTKNTVLFYDGYPRSGNTFLHMLIKNVYNKIDVVHHFHSIGAIKIALEKQLPTFIIYRDAINAVSSNYLKEYSFQNKYVDTKNIDKHLLNSLLENYIYYYQYVVRCENCHLISFDKLIADPAKIITSLNQEIPLEHRRKIELIEQIVTETKDKDFGARDKLGSSRPNEEKEKLKKVIGEQIISLESFDTAEKLYKKLKTAHNNV